MPDTWSELFVLTLPAQTDQEAQYFKDFSNTNMRSDGINGRIQEAAKAIWETKDIRDELRLLRQLFESQAEVIRDLAEIFWPTKAYRGKDRESRQVLKENFIRDCGLEALIRRVKKMDDDAATTSDGVGFFLFSSFSFLFFFFAFIYLFRKSDQNGNLAGECHSGNASPSVAKGGRGGSHLEHSHLAFHDCHGHLREYL